VNAERLPIVVRFADRDRQEVARPVRYPLPVPEVVHAGPAFALRLEPEEPDDAPERGDAAHV